MDWSNEKILEFISNYEDEPILWNPKEPGHKRKDLIYDAWVRIKTNLGFSCTVEDLKKKRDALMAYYRQHLNKKKKSLKSGAGMEDIYNINWFAFGPLHSFLQPVYECNKTIDTEASEKNNDEENEEPGREMTTSAAATDYGTQRAKRPRLRDCDLSSELNTARQQMNEAFNVVKNNSCNDEYEIFGKLIANKIRKVQNYNIKEILMIDIHNIVFKGCMFDKLKDPITQLPQSFIPANDNEKRSQFLQPSSSTSSNSSHPPFRSPQFAYTQQYQSPQSPYIQQPQSPQSPYTQQPQSPQSPYTQQPQSPQSPYIQQPQSPQSPYIQQPQSPQSPVIQPRQSPQSQYEQPYQSLQSYTNQSSTSFNSTVSGQNRILPPKKSPQIILTATGELILADCDEAE